jgi:hypothetical protein
MSKLEALVDLSTSYGSQAAINSNNAKITTAFQNTLSRDGSTPNAMAAQLDMGDNDIINVSSITVDSITLNGQLLDPLTTAAAASAASALAAMGYADDAEASADAAAASEAVVVDYADNLPDWKGPWQTATVYSKNHIVRESNNSYICLVDHTSGTFSADLSSVYWELFVPQGSPGAGTGDLQSTNNLDDVANADASLANLGGTTEGVAIFKAANKAAVRAQIDVEVGTDVQAHSDALDDIAGLSLAEGDLLSVDSSGNIVNVTVGNDNDILISYGGEVQWLNPSSLPTWTYVSEVNISGGTDVTYNLSAPITEADLFFYDIGASGSNYFLVQLKSGGVWKTSGYGSASSGWDTGNTFSSSGFPIANVGGRHPDGMMVLRKGYGNRWYSMQGFETNGLALSGGGHVDLGAEIEAFRLVLSGSNTFNSGIMEVRIRA